MHNMVWEEAAKRRTNGVLLTSFKKIQSKLFLIQGETDPHPTKGVIAPLLENGVKCELYVLEKCGHSPFMEKYAKEEFYKLLLKILV